mmetsp:Transcript_8808/g.13180  ORF Transcript_8808/g.13180 Transcript_8808/m.13180 type:complete len:708 (-) Transcript_8808:282-2405(-)
MGSAVSVTNQPHHDPCFLHDSDGLLHEYLRLKTSGDNDSQIYHSIRHVCSSIRQQEDQIHINHIQTTVQSLALQRLTQTLRSDSIHVKKSASYDEEGFDSVLSVKQSIDDERTTISEVPESVRTNIEQSYVAKPRRKPSLSVDVDNEEDSYAGKALAITPVVSSTTSPSGTLHVGDFSINQRIMTESSEFVEVKCLGNGSTSRVIEALHMPSMTLVALKMLQVNDNDDVKRVSSELSVLYENMAELQLLHDELDVKVNNLRNSTSSNVDDHVVLSDQEERCSNVLGMYDAFVSPETGMVNIVVEYMDGGSLEDVVNAGGCQDEIVVAQITKQVLEGLLFLHSKKQLHRDIKPGNILINCNGGIKIADFGLAKVASIRHDHQNSFVGTLNYMSPERIMNSAYSFPSDIWSLGIAVVTVVQGKHPYVSFGSNYWEIVRCICDEDSPNVGLQYSEELRDFVSLCLEKEPSDRPSVEELLRHKFIAKAAIYSAATTAETISPQLSFDNEFQHDVPTEEEINRLVDIAVIKISKSASTASSTSSVAQLANHSIAQRRSLSESDCDINPPQNCVSRSGKSASSVSLRSDSASNEDRDLRMDSLLMAARLEHMELILSKIVSKYRSVERIRKSHTAKDMLLKWGSFDETSMRSVSRRKGNSIRSVRVENMEPIPDPYNGGMRLWKHFARQLHIPLEIVLLSVKNIIPGDMFSAD